MCAQSNLSPHDKGVQAEARELQREGWNVRADHLNGWSNPPKINGHYPDVYATKRGSRRIIEIETDASEDKAQHTAFRRHASQKQNTIFYGRVVDRGGNRRRTFR